MIRDTRRSCDVTEMAMLYSGVHLREASGPSGSILSRDHRLIHVTHRGRSLLCLEI